MKKISCAKSIYIILFLVLISSCKQNYEEIEIFGITNMKEISLSCDKNKDYVSGIELIVTGFVDGDIIIEQSNKSNVTYNHKIDSGQVNENYSGDWYAKECLLRILPQNTDSIYLKIKYRFY